MQQFVLGQKSWQNNPYVKNCGNNNTATLHEIYNHRIPYDVIRGIDQIPSTCKDALRNTIRMHESEDKKDWESLANRLCSAKNGWVEKKSGTCQAGGPPPICPLDHWYKDPVISMQRWYDEQHKIRKEREKELRENGCHCWATVIDNNENNKNFDFKLSDISTNNSQSTSSSIPCYNGNCPPGFECLNGICNPNSSRTAAVQVVKELWDNPVSNKFKKAYIKQYILDVYGESSSVFLKVYKGFNSFGVGVALKVFESTQISTWEEVYNKNIISLKDYTTTYKDLLLEYDRAIEHGPNCMCRDPQSIKIDLQNLQIKMDKTFRSLNIAFSEMTNRQSNCKNCCNEVFITYHKWYCYYYLKISTIRP